MEPVADLSSHVLKQLPGHLSRAVDRDEIAGRNFNFQFRSRKPKLVCKPGSPLASFLVEQCPIVTKSYRPPIWCSGGHSQTMAAVIFRKCKPVQYRRELLELQDGGEIALDWLDSESEKFKDPATQPTVLILPELASSSRQPAVMHLVKQIAKNGYRVVVFNRRGSGGVRLKTTKTFSMTNTEDLDCAITHIHKTFPGVPLLAVGNCIGGMALTRYLIDAGSQGKDTGLVGALTVSMPWNISTTVRSLEEPLNYFTMNQFLVKYIKKLMWRNRALWRKDEDHTDLLDGDIISSVLGCKTIHELNNVVLAPTYGFENADAYYEAVSLHSAQLDAINVPMLCLNAADDPIVPRHSIPYEQIGRSPNIVLALTAHGGHIGFTQGLFLSGPSFADKLAVQFVRAIFERGAEITAAKNSVSNTC